MSSCLGGGGGAYTIDLNIIKSPSSSWISCSSSPSSTLSELSNSPHTISTRKARAPRKRPNQTYNEAVAILSTAHPKLFPTKNLKTKFTKSCHVRTKNPFLFEPSDLLMPFQTIESSSAVLVHPPIVGRPHFAIEPKGLNPFEKSCQSPREITSKRDLSEICDECREDFDAESMLDEEIEEGIDSIMGNLSMENETNDDDSSILSSSTSMQMKSGSYGFPLGLGFDFGNGMRRELKAMRNVDEGDWWRFPTVNVLDETQKTTRNSAEKKKKKKVEIKNSNFSEENLVGVGSDAPSEESISRQNAGLLLKLNYDNVLNAWSDRGSPFSADAPVAESAGNDVQARLAQIDLFPENGGATEAVVLRYKQKQRPSPTLFSKKTKNQVRKVDTDQRPRRKELWLTVARLAQPEDGEIMNINDMRCSSGSLTKIVRRLKTLVSIGAEKISYLTPTLSHHFSLVYKDILTQWRRDGGACVGHCTPMTLSISFAPLAQPNT